MSAPPAKDGRHAAPGALGARVKPALRSLASTAPARTATRGALWIFAAASRLASVMRTAALFEGPNRPVCHWSAVLKYPGKIRCGAGVVIGPRATLGAAGGIALGDHVRISEGALIETAGLVFTDAAPFAHAARAICIEEGAWIGARAIVLGGVTIGRHAVVGAGAIVSRDVPANMVVVAQPPILRAATAGRTATAAQPP